jgi:RNA polymerase sigma-70 factor (ECF subfamily)
LLCAWRFLHTFKGRGPLRAWLYRIATTTCLKAGQVRTRQPATVEDLTYLQPCPDRLLDQIPAADGDPAAEAERRESVSLAFITALQLLPATQSAVLILRDVLGWSSAEVADLLDTSVAAVNSALQRARTTFVPRRGRCRCGRCRNRSRRSSPGSYGPGTAATSTGSLRYCAKT